METPKFYLPASSALGDKCRIQPRPTSYSVQMRGSQSGDGLGFALEAFAKGIVIGEMVRKNFNGDRAVQPVCQSEERHSRVVPTG
jgi:hypothetical protein